MTLDSSDSLSAAQASRRLPEGARDKGTDTFSGSKVEALSPAGPADPWSYLYLHHQTARTFGGWLDRYNSSAATPQHYFIHQSYHYQYRNKEKQTGVCRTLRPSVSGLVFLQGPVQSLQQFLNEYFPVYHLVNDCSTGRPASIPDSVMQPFMRVMQTRPERITFLREPFERFARDHVRLRVVSGVFAGYEGYIVRIDRDRQLVFDFGGHAVAIRGMHNEQFEEVGG